jgi:hypothetical protein
MRAVMRDERVRLLDLQEAIEDREIC